MAEAIKLNKGTIQHIIVDVTDRLGNLDSLDGTGPTFDIRIKEASSWLDQGESATSIGMTAYCLVDTSPAGYVPDEYELYLQFSNLPESPRLGPIRFEVNA